MNIPKLKRIKISSMQELQTWLIKNQDQKEDVMLVVHNKKSPKKYISHEQLLEALTDTVWISGFSYTLNAQLIGRVIKKRTSANN